MQTEVLEVRVVLASWLVAMDAINRVQVKFWCLQAGSLGA